VTASGNSIASVYSNCPADEPLRMLCGFINDHDPVHVIGPLVTRLLGALVVVALVVAAGRLLRGLVDRTLERASRDRQLRILARNLLNMTTLMIAGLAALGSLGLSVSVVVTSLGLTGLVVGLALQDLLRNVLAGIFLLVERPFRIGNAISVGDLSGTVETIQLRTTGIRTVDGRLAIMPNLNAFNGIVINSSALPLRRCTVSLSVPQGVDPEALPAAVRTELAQTPAIATEPTPEVVTKPDPDGGVSVRVTYWLDHRMRDENAVAADLAPRLRAAIGGMACAPAPLAHAPTGSGGARHDPAVAL
jgi:small conductance mechanosensitive channel